MATGTILGIFGTLTGSSLLGAGAGLALGYYRTESMSILDIKERAEEIGRYGLYGLIVGLIVAILIVLVVLIIGRIIEIAKPKQATLQSEKTD